MTEPVSFQDRLAEYRKKKAAQEAASTEQPLPNTPVDESDIVQDPYPDRSDQDKELDSFFNNLNILNVYTRWIAGGGKVVDDKTTGRREGVKVSCPNPDHPDKHPSAWLNIDKSTFYCAGCDEGGDIYDLAAIKFGYPRPGYKEGKAFHDLRKDMAENYGFRFKRLLDGSTQVYKQSPEQNESSDSPQNEGLDTDDKLRTAPARSSLSSDNPSRENTDSSDEPDSSNVSHMWADEEEAEEELILWPDLSWREMVPEDTFLYEYCDTTANDDSPEEYHFFHGLVALAHVVGRNVYLDDTQPVYSNMLVCLLGGTGYGKSKSRKWLNQVLRDVSPFKDNGLDCEGVKIISPPASGEFLIRQFQHVATDPSFGKNAPQIFTPVNGIVDFDEFASLLARANRQGNILKPVIMGFADSADQVATGSLTSGDIRAEYPFCSITSSTQPKAVRTLMSKNDAGSGFLNRWIFVGGKRKEREVIGGARSRIRVDLTLAKDTLKNVKAWGAVERAITFSDEGHAEITRFYRQRVFPMQDKDDTDLLKRLDLLFKRMILLFAINERKQIVEAELVQRVEMLFEYILFCYGAISSEIGITQMSEISQEILRHVSRHYAKTKRGASARDLQKYMKRKNYSPDLIKRALETMIALDLIEIEDKKSQIGRPTIRYVEVI